MHPTIVEYGVREMMKGKSPEAAARVTDEKLSGSHNLFLGPDVVEIDADELVAELWNRMVEYTLKNMVSTRVGMEHYALDGTMINFGQVKLGRPVSVAVQKRRQRLKTLIIQALGRNPFPNDEVR